jgi:hypothetical protein
MLRKCSQNKAWYDLHCSKNKSFGDNEKVIVLIPDDSRKLFARWSEPMTVKRHNNDRNYEIDMGGNKHENFSRQSTAQILRIGRDSDCC